MLSIEGERTLIGAILPPKSSHINGVISIVFRNQTTLVELTALTSSIVLDFFLKTISSQNLTNSRMLFFPLGIDSVYRTALYSRTLLLNCLNKNYSVLWNKIFEDSFTNQQWSVCDSRLKNFSQLKKEWDETVPIRNFYARRIALVEIDVLSTMALGLTLEELILIYKTQFSVMMQNEEDTWYDSNGNIVFTCNSQGLNGVGLDRPAWESMRGELSEDGMTYAGTAPTYEHTIVKSELYQGQKQTFVAPYTRCDRIADYRRAWAHFEKQFK
jgi:hypothetical protein